MNNMYKRNRDYLTFDNIQELPRQLFDVMLGNDDLFKLINYDDSDPLSNPNLTLKEKLSLIYEGGQQDNARVYFMSFTDNVEDEEQTQLRIYISNINIEQDNIAEIFFSVDVICHNNLTILGDSSNRLLRMINQVVKVLNGYTGSFSITQLQMPIGGNLRLVYYNKHFQGYMIPFKARVNNGSVCNLER